jgi:hypothetical protein
MLCTFYAVTIHVEREVIIKARIPELFHCWNQNKLDFRHKCKTCWWTTIRYFTDGSRPQLFSVQKLAD